MLVFEVDVCDMNGKLLWAYDAYYKMFHFCSLCFSPAIFSDKMYWSGRYIYNIHKSAILHTSVVLCLVLSITVVAYTHIHCLRFVNLLFIALSKCVMFCVFSHTHTHTPRGNATHLKTNKIKPAMKEDDNIKGRIITIISLWYIYPFISYEGKRFIKLNCISHIQKNVVKYMRHDESLSSFRNIFFFFHSSFLSPFM